MEAIVQLIHAHSSNLEHLNSELRSIQLQVSGAIQSPQVIDEMLATLNPKEHAFGMLWLLSLKTPFLQQNYNDPRFIPQVASVFLHGSRRHFANYDLVDTVAESLLALAVRTGNVLAVVAPLKAALKASVPHLTTLSKLHGMFLQACLIAKCYRAALDVLSQDILEVEAERYPVKAINVLLYFYYGGLVYTGVKQWKRAVYFFQVAISVPASAVSSVVIESYKKFVLVSLLSSGQVEPLPKYTSITVSRYLKSLTEYTDFADACSSLNVDRAVQVANAAASVFQRDQNFGLVKQCLSSIHHRIIIRLTKTFLTLSLPDIAKHAHLSSAKAAEDEIRAMIEAGDITARISQKDGMVSFYELPDTFDSPETIALVEAKVAQSMELYRQVAQTTHAVTLHPAYLHRLTLAEKSSGTSNDEEYDFRV